MEPIWGRQDPDGHRVGPMNIAIWVFLPLMSWTLNIGSNCFFYLWWLSPRKPPVLLKNQLKSTVLKSEIHLSSIGVDVRGSPDIEVQASYNSQWESVYQNQSLQWRHNGLDSVSNHQPHDSLLNRLFRSRSKKTSKLRATGLCSGNSPETGEFPAQRASNAENVSIWWRHHEWLLLKKYIMQSSVLAFAVWYYHCLKVLSSL